MLAFQTEVDIANRALQHCGATRIESFSDDSKSASEVSFCYDKVRQAELRRNPWKFAIRTTCLRPLNSLSAILGQSPSSTTGILAVGASMFLRPPVYSASVSYPLGAIVADVNNVLWQSQTPNNLNGIFGQQWTEFFGSLVVSPFDTTDQTAYYPGELVYETLGPGQFNTYLSLCYTNGADPGTPTPYNSTVIYYAGQVVQDANLTSYMCLQNGTIGVEPDSQPSPWSVSTTYAAGAKVAATDGYIYTSIGSGNINHNPANDASPTYWTQNGYVAWTSVFSTSLGSDNWQLIDCELAPINIIYPIGTGPTWQTFTKNIFLLPNAYLGPAPQDPKAGANSFLGAPNGDQYREWQYDGNFILSDIDSVIVLRFIADVNEVPTFDPMFCEGLAARIAMEVVEPLTQSLSKMQTIQGVYSLTIKEARAKNFIESGPVEPPEDDYVACRI
jgi:hypothetical protein